MSRTNTTVFSNRKEECFLLTSANTANPKILINKLNNTPFVFQVPKESVGVLVKIDNRNSLKFISTSSRI